MHKPGCWRWWLLALILAWVWAAGCGYRPLGTEPKLRESRPTLAIPLFANRSTEIGLEAIMANALIQAVTQSGMARVTPKVEDADLVLEGRVYSVENTSVAFFSITQSLVRRVTIRVELVLRKRPEGKIIWKDTVTIQEDYVVDPNYHIGETLRAASLRRAAVNMARRTLDKLMMII